MLYQPNYCCHCGESIERIEWKLWTSRRFCEHCETAFQKEDWIPKIGFGLAILFGLFGFGSYLKNPEKPLNLTNSQLIVSASNKTQNVKQERIIPSSNDSNSLKNIKTTVESNTLKNPPGSQKQEKGTLTDNLQNDSVESVYFCGAQTKKGTPCTRKVKGSNRCWQHQGQPAMLPKEKLVVSQ